MTKVIKAMEQIIPRYQAGEAMARLAREFGVGYQTLRQRLLKIQPPARKRGQHENVSEVDRFWRHTMPEPNSGCWLWLGKHDERNGYGYFFLGKRWVTAQRAAWMLLRGPIPDRMHVDHVCRNRACVNPDHLEPVTQAVNLSRRVLIKTHCLRGHPLTEGNLMIEVVNGKQIRRCKKCRQKRKRP
jgi:HNH endonuclease